MALLTVTVVGNVTWRAIRNVRDVWIGVCDDLKLTVQATSWPDLAATIAEVQSELLIGLLRDGELEQFLTRHGWATNQPLPEREADVQFDLPAQILPDSASASAR